MLGGLRAEEMQAEGCQREMKALQCTVHKLFSFSFLALCSGLQAAAADPMLPPRFPSDTLLVPIHGASNVCANHGRVRSRLAGWQGGGGELVEPASVAVSSSPNGHGVLHPR